ncbi:MAG: extracellular solute-binding protein [Oscillospiraceae bacterium]|nr:extracellular solute-binding protein [Oscillospiraceae bacterium]
MKIKRILSLVLAIALMAVVFVGCDTDSTDDSNTSTDAAIEANAKLKVWGPAASLDVLKKQAKAFEEANADKNVKIECVAQEESDAGTQLLNDPTVAADVFGFASDQLTKLNLAKALLPVYTDYEDKIKENHTEAAVQTVKGDFEGQEVLYAFPETDNGYYLVYDKSVVSDEDAKSLEGVLAACKKAGRQFIMDAGNGYYSCMFAFTGGLKLEGLDGEAQDIQKFNNYNEDDVVASMQAFSKLFREYKGTFTPASADKISAGFLTKKKTCGAGIDGTWNAAIDSEALGDDYGVLPLPTININGKDTSIVGMIGYKYIGVNAKSKYPNAAMAFADYLADKDCQKDRFDELGWTPTHKGVEVGESLGTKAMLTEAKTFVVQANIIQQFWDPFANLGTQLYKDGTKNDTKTLKTLLDKTLANVNG